MSIPLETLVALRRMHQQQRRERQQVENMPNDNQTLSVPQRSQPDGSRSLRASASSPWLPTRHTRTVDAVKSREVRADQASVSSTAAAPRTIFSSLASSARRGPSQHAASPLPLELMPKVMAPDVPLKGELPREELAARKRQRLDAYPALQVLLEKRGIPADGAAAAAEVSCYHTLLPLEAFDDQRLEEFSPEVWRQRIHAVVDEGKTPGGLSCRALRVQNGRGTWEEACVVDWDLNSNLLSARFVGDSREATPIRLGAAGIEAPRDELLQLPRIFVCFHSEDPSHFVDRFAAAYASRRRAEEMIREELIVASIPPDEYQMLDPVVLDRIRRSAFNTPKLVEGESNADAQSLMAEIRGDYSYVMNADLFREVASAGGLGSLLPAATPPFDAPTPTAAVSFDAVDAALYAAALRDFQSSCFFAQGEAPNRIFRFMRTCSDGLLSRKVFQLAMELEPQRSLPLLTFEEVQSNSLREGVQFLRDRWVLPITDTVKDVLGSFSSDSTLHLDFLTDDDYVGTKTQEFFFTLNVAMGDVVRHLILDNLEAFTRFIEDAGNFCVSIESMNTVHLSVGDHPAPTTAFGFDGRTMERFLQKPPHSSAPLLKVTILYETPKEALAATPEASDGDDAAAEEPTAPSAPSPQLRYSASSTQMMAVLSSLVVRFMTSHSEVRSVERRIFDFLYNPVGAFVESVSPSDPRVQSCLARMQAVLDRTAGYMDAYLETYNVYDALVQINVKEYIEAFGASIPKAKDVAREIQRFMSLQEEIYTSVTPEVNLGLVCIDASDLRRHLSSKCGQVASGMLKVIAAHALKKEEYVDEKFAALHDTLMKSMDTPEEVVATKDFIKTIPEHVFDLQQVIQEARDIHDVLHHFHYVLPEDEFDKKWKAIAWPGQLDDEVNQRLQELEEAKRSLVATMNRSQDMFETEVERVQQLIENYHQHSNPNRQAEIAKDVHGILDKIQSLRDQANTFNTHEELFNLEKTSYAAVHQLSADFEPYASLWLTIHDWSEAMRQLEDSSFSDIDARALEQRVADDLSIMVKCTRATRLTADLIAIAEQTVEKIERFKPMVPVIKCLRMEGMKQRHWDQLSKEVGREVRPGETLNSLEDIRGLKLLDESDVLTRISEIASREYQIEASLAKMKASWGSVRMSVKAHKETGCFIISKDVIDDTQEKLDDQMLLTQSLLFSPFKKKFESEIVEWESALKLVQSVLDSWLTCQRSWLYLEPIFQSEDISRQIPMEHKRFQLVSKNWKYLTQRAHEVDLMMEFCTTTDRCLELLKENNDTLELVERGLNQYLENKRASFARFYFLSDDELLTILSEARDPQKIQPEFRKLFENIAHIEMRAPENEMFGMYSQLGEYIPFVHSLYPRKSVESWLMAIEQMMKLSVRAQLEKGVADCASMSRRGFLLAAPGQVAIAVSQIMWTHECEESLREHGSLSPYVPSAKEKLMELVEIVRQPLTPLQRMNLGGLITTEVHACDIVQQLAEQRVDSVFSFEWISQLRSYWVDGDCYLRQVEAQFRYGGEYLGNTSRLVITPLTDRIYLTLTGAMHMFLGGAPAGPAGTGKTETVKDLAKAIAKECVVFNCQEGMTYASMGKFFKGLAQAGAWACFDEFNRIDVEVLSVVAQQVSSLQEAARSRQYRIPFEGTEITVDPSYAVFITMNPGYAGRTELPDNLKALFRPVACMVPDYAMIAEIRLFSFGYADSRVLARKMVATFRLSSEQLSSQDHYDFGMRAVNTVISAAGLMKREHPDEAEDILLLRALRDSNTPKFLDEDLLLFSGIISDLFPGVELVPTKHDVLLPVLHETCATMHLQPTEMFVKKCLQVYEMSILRHGQMTVGPAMGGKTCATRVLQAALTRLRVELKNPNFAEVKTHCVNPKAVTMSQLYGGFDEATAEWRDGLVGELFRIAARDTTDARQWIVFDGPVDALWIESMNTVLDDNKKLCLISGEIIAMTPRMNCFFEVEDLAVASPATVSRAGMIYMEPDSCVGVSNLVKSWRMYQLPVTMGPYMENLEDLCNQMFPALIHFVHTQVTEYSPSIWPNLVTSCFNIYTALLEPYTPTKTQDVPLDKLNLLSEVYLHFLVFAMVWSFGATGDATGRKHFDKFLRDELQLRNVNIDLPVIGCLHDYEFSPEDRRWIPWTERLPAFTAKVTQFNVVDLIVPTADVARYKYINKLLLQRSFHTLCCGPTGTGKTAILQQLLLEEMPKEYAPIFFTFSARTSANQTQDLIFSKLEVRRRASPQIWGSPLSKKFVVLVDDMNMPIKEQYGAQPPIELLRQFLDYGGWYDRTTREFFHIVDVILMGVMAPAGGGRNTVSHRFLRHFNQIAFPDIDEANMRLIYTTILENYFQPFPEDIRRKLGAVVAASIEVFTTVTTELLPTPAHPHYLFNLRDLAKVMSGVVNATTRTIKSVPSLIRLWLHEEMRTFRDRLTNEADQTWFDKLLARQVEQQFKVEYAQVMPSAAAGDGQLADLFFVAFPEGAQTEGGYHEVGSVASLTKTMEDQLATYNHQSLGNKLNLVLFTDAVRHVCRIARVICKPNGHVLLLGVGGSGRQSVSRLAAHLSELEVFQVEITKGYTTSTWREDIKTVLRRVAFKNKQVLFLFTDTQIAHESMLEDVNNLLNSGEVPNLFVAQELEDVLGTMKPICISENLPLDKVSVYARFVRACRSNLHISLCLSPLGEAFRNRLRMFPALVSCCTIDWFSSWPQQALHSVAHNYLRGLTALEEARAIETCTEVCVHIHRSVEAISMRFLREARRHVYVTPTSFLELLYSFRTLLESEMTKNLQVRNRLENSLAKLKETEEAVAGLQETLAQSQPVLLEKSESIQLLVAEMAKQTASAEVTKKEAQTEREAVAGKQSECAAIEEEAQNQLAEALPELDRALESLKNLKTSQIAEVAGYKAPTTGVIMTMQGICTLFQIKPAMRAASALEEKKADYWVTAKEQLLNNPSQLLQRLIHFDKEHIPEKLIQAVMPLVSSEDFTPKKIAGASQACAAMCQWTHAMVRFHQVNKQVEPLRQRLAIAQEANQSAQEKLQQAEDRLEEVARSLAEMQARKTSAEEEMATLQATVKKTEVKLERASMLISGLAGEKKNWSRSVDELKTNAKYLMGNMLAAAGQIAYSGPFTTDFRRELVEDWTRELALRGIEHSASLSVFHTLQDAVQTRGWAIHGLPMDALSVENALFLTYARRWPLMVDPQTQANKWIRQTYKGSIEILKPTQRDLIKRIEYCIRAGRPVLLENVGEDIDPSLNPLLLKQTFTQGGVEMIRISDTAIPWNPKFKFFMTTKLPNPHYTPEAMVRVTLLNFFITPQGLEDQLLGVVVGQERKELEARRNDLIEKNAAMKADLAETQKTILRKLEEVQGDILDDVELIEYLNESRVKTDEITTKVAEAEGAEVEINASREGYRPIARHSACLYFCCSTLSNVDPMYQYSLQWFVQLFLASIDQAAVSDDLDTRLRSLREYFTYSFYQNVSRSLFERHKLLFSFFLCVRLQEQDGHIDAAELHFLLNGPALLPKVEDNPDPSWVTPSIWNEICYLSTTFPAFHGFSAHFAANVEYYHSLFMSSAAHRQPLHEAWPTALSPVQHMMFLRCVRLDKLVEAVQDFVCDAIGEKFIRPPPFDLPTSYKDSSVVTPLIFILSQGADPYEDWRKFAESQRMTRKLYDISLGQGQGPRAERMLQEGMESGAWVLLQNCHLATSWMPTLERLVEGIPPETHPSFRLWLTSMPSAHFPASVLQNGIKMTNEPPKGMQANVTRSILNFSDELLDTGKKSVELRKLYFSMFFFHAVVQERRKYGPLGWNIAYDFTTGDLGCCIAQIKMFVEQYDEVPFKVIRELSGNIHYGGRVTDELDRRTLLTVLEPFVCPDVMQDTYCFAPPIDIYRSIPATDCKGYMDYVASWPINTRPEVLGLHENADIAYALSETMETLAAMVQLHGEESTTVSGGKTPEEEVLEVAAAIRLKLHAPFDIEQFRKKYPTRYEDSMNTVLVQEAIRFHKLLAVVHHSLDSLPLAIKGEVVMSKELEEVQRSIYNNQVPVQWANYAYPSLKPLASWADDLVARLAMIEDWYLEGHPKAYWISGLFFPQAFLTGILQNFARRMQLSIDTISYDFEWMSGDVQSLSAAPDAGCYVYGMFIEGGRVDPETRQLVESKPKVLYESAPLLLLKPVVHRGKPSASVYQCPLYKTTRRAGTLSTTGHSTNYVLTIEIPTAVDPKHWVKRGVAMVCSLST